MSVFWKLSQAMVWIATRDEDAVAAAPDKVLILRLTDTNSGSIAGAQQKLWGALQIGDLEATGIGKDGERRAIPATRWLDLRPILDNENDELLEPRPFAGEGFHCVAVTSADVRKQWPASPPTGKRGPKPKVDYSAFEREVHSWLAENGVPNPQLDPKERQADLERHMSEFHNDAIGESRNRVLVSRAIASYKSKYEGL